MGTLESIKEQRENCSDLLAALRSALLSALLCSCPPALLPRELHSNLKTETKKRKITALEQQALSRELQKAAVL